MQIERGVGMGWDGDGMGWLIAVHGVGSLPLWSLVSPLSLSPLSLSLYKVYR